MLRNPPLDVNGHEIPWSGDDAVIEAGLDDPAYGDAVNWPSWTDSFSWELELDSSPDLQWLEDHFANNWKMPHPPADVLDFVERLDYERNCNARFV